MALWIFPIQSPIFNSDIVFNFNYARISVQKYDWTKSGGVPNYNRLRVKYNVCFRFDNLVLENWLWGSILGEEETSCQPSLIAYSSSARGGPLDISPAVLACLLVLSLVRLRVQIEQGPPTRCFLVFLSYFCCHGCGSNPLLNACLMACNHIHNRISL